MSAFFSRASDLLLLFSVIIVQWLTVGKIEVADGAVFGSDPRYSLWPNPARIPFQLTPGIYNNDDFGNLNQAIIQLRQDTAGCINFEPYDSAIDRGKDFILFRNRLTSGVVDVCYTFPGLIKNNGFGQVAVIFSSQSYPGQFAGSSSPNLPGACLDTPRDAMRLLVNLLSIRSEHNRNDRNSFLTFLTPDPNQLVLEALQKYNLFIPYNATSPTIVASNFDYESITMVSGTKFAKSPNRPVFVTTNGAPVGQLARLSRTDCLLINMLYKCNSPCVDPYASSGVNFNPTRTFTKHLYCPPLVTSLRLEAPLIIGDVTITNAEGVTFRYTLSPSTPYLTVQPVFRKKPGVANTFTIPAARIILTAIPPKGFVNSQFTLTANSGNLQGSTIVTLTINCVPNFVSSTGGRPTFNKPVSIGQPATFTNPPNVFTVQVGDPQNPGIYVNCKDSIPDFDQAELMPSTFGFVTATDPEGGRISYHITSPLPNFPASLEWYVTPDGVIGFANNEENPPANVQGKPFENTGAGNTPLFVAAVDPLGGMSVLKYSVYHQCGPPA